MKSLTALLLSAATAAFALAGVARGGVVQADLKALTRSGTWAAWLFKKFRI